MEEGDMATQAHTGVPPGTPPKLDWVKFWWEAAKGVAVAVAAVYSFAANQQGQHNATALEMIRLSASERAQQAQLDIKVYELVEKALSLDAAVARGHGVAAAAIINALTKPPLRSQLLSALRAGSKDETLIRQLDEARQFDLEVDPAQAPAPAPAPPSQNADPKRTSQLDRGATLVADSLITPARAQSSPGALKGYSVDIFYCEGQSQAVTDAREKRARKAGDQLQRSGIGVNVRVRRLPTLIQVRPGYQSASDEIRFNDLGNEREAAAQLAKTIGIRPEDTRRIDYQTPGYISVFYCAG